MRLASLCSSSELRAPGGQVLASSGSPHPHLFSLSNWILWLDPSLLLPTPFLPQFPGLPEVEKVFL